MTFVVIVRWALACGTRRALWFCFVAVSDLFKTISTHRWQHPIGASNVSLLADVPGFLLSCRVSKDGQTLPQ